MKSINQQKRNNKRSQKINQPPIQVRKEKHYKSETNLTSKQNEKKIPNMTKQKRLTKNKLEFPTLLQNISKIKQYY